MKIVSVLLLVVIVSCAVNLKDTTNHDIFSADRNAKITQKELERLMAQASGEHDVPVLDPFTQRQQYKTNEKLKNAQKLLQYNSEHQTQPQTTTERQSQRLVQITQQIKAMEKETKESMGKQQELPPKRVYKGVVPTTPSADYVMQKKQKIYTPKQQNVPTMSRTQREYAELKDLYKNY